MMYELSGIPCADAGLPKISATFGVDVNGMLRVDVVDNTDGAGNLIKPLIDLR